MKVSFRLLKVVCVLSCVWLLACVKFSFSFTLAPQLSILPAPARTPGDPTSQVFFSLPYHLKKSLPTLCVHSTPLRKIRQSQWGKCWRSCPSPPSCFTHLLMRPTLGPVWNIYPADAPTPSWVEAQIHSPHPAS